VRVTAAGGFGHSSAKRVGEVEGRPENTSNVGPDDRRSQASGTPAGAGPIWLPSSLGAAPPELATRRNLEPQLRACNDAAGFALTELPTGTVTFLFTDVEGSTRLLHELGAEEYAEALGEHRQVMREAVAVHGGVEVDTQGDAFFFAFASAPAALAAAVAARDGLADGPIRARMGLHAGTPLVTDDGYVGPDVHRAARIAAAGHGGQILVSAAAAALVGRARLRDLGPHRLKDLLAPERIYQIGDEKFPPLKSLHQTNLPIPATPFLGRERELLEVLQFLTRDDIRLLTLTGAGGAGKTRLAAQAAALVSEEYADGVWWVPLAPLRDPQLVVPTAAQVLGAKDGVADHIGDQSMLLLLDNFEQVVEGATDVAQLLGSCPNLNVLVTSREPLRVTGEQEYQVLPLVHKEGVGFFVARARAMLPDFEADESVSEICRRLDDLPLALELAAARVKALTTQQILERLEQRFPLLSGGARDLPKRQRTLRATIEWSYELLRADEQQLFERLGVFRGGCALDAAERIADANVDILQSLVDKSLLHHTRGRYWMLETIREFAFERLNTLGETEQLRRKHANWYASHARVLEEQRRTEDASASALAGLERDVNNFRAALRFRLDNQEYTDALELACDLQGLWRWRGYASEGRRWLSEGLAAEGDISRPIEARSLHLAGILARLQGDLADAKTLHEQHLDLSRQERDPSRVADALKNLGIVCTLRGEHEQARNYFHESLASYEASGDLSGTAGVRHALANLAGIEGDLAAARKLHEENLRLNRTRRDLGLTASTLNNLGYTALLQRDYDAADRCLSESLTLYQRLGDKEGAAIPALNLGCLAIQRGQPRDAEQHLVESLTALAEIRDARGCAGCLEAFAALALAAQRPRRAARLLGAAAALRSKGGHMLAPAEQDVLDELTAEASNGLGPDAFDATWREGEALSFSEKIAYALEEQEHGSPRR
jgi:predicted ATPase/class 3 adenylate cyclase/Tfp pilus assembly protein PilF